MTGWVTMLVALSSVGRASAEVTWRPPAPGEVVVRLTTEAELSRYRVLRPLSLAPDVIVGLPRRTSVAVHHSRRAAGLPRAGAGVCVIAAHETLGPADETCPAAVTEPAASATIEVRRALVVRGGLGARSWRLDGLAARIGAAYTAERGRWWASAWPQLTVGLTGRRDGVRERAAVWLDAGHSFGPAGLHVSTGIEGALATFDETFAIPLGVGGSVRVRNVRLGAAVSFDRALGALNGMFWRSGYVFVEVVARRRR